MVVTVGQNDKLWIFDFDGTISPLVPNRTKARLHPLCRELFEVLLASPHHRIAVLSSRLLDDLANRVLVPGVFLGGGSGLEWLIPGGRRLVADAHLQKQLRQRRKELLPKIKSVGSIAGVEIEDKKWSIAIHFRKASVRSKKLIHTMLEDWGPVRRLRKFKGPEVVEIQLLPGIDKSYGVRRLSEILRFEPAGGTLIYSGDDENDATAMKWVLHLKGIAFTVGPAALVPGSRVVDSPSSLAREIRKLAGLGEKFAPHPLSLAPS